MGLMGVLPGGARAQVGHIRALIQNLMLGKLASIGLSLSIHKMGTWI